MNIYDYADTLNLDICLTRYSNQDNRWSASFEHCETKDDSTSSCLGETYGNGTSPNSAITDYITKIQGRLLVVNAAGKRRGYVVPRTLTTV